MIDLFDEFIKETINFFDGLVEETVDFFDELAGRAAGSFAGANSLAQLFPTMNH